MVSKEPDFDFGAAVSRAAVLAVAAGPLDIMASLSPEAALATGALAATVGLLSEKAAALDGRRQVVAAGFSGMQPEEVDNWLTKDRRNLTLAVQAVMRATAAFDQAKIDALGRAFRAGVTDDAKVDESTFVVAALGIMERPHIDVLHLLVTEKFCDPSRDHQYMGLWSTDNFAERMPQLGNVMTLISSQLTAAGVITTPSGYWQLTGLGRLCVEYLSDS